MNPRRLHAAAFASPLKTATSLVVLLSLGGCGGGQKSASGPLLPPRSQSTPSAAALANAPEWIAGARFGEGELCGYGVAGASFSPDSPYPKEMAEERAVLNLAGIIETKVLEAIIDRNTKSGAFVRRARHLMVDEALLEKVRAQVKTDYYRDEEGVGPFSVEGFTYAHACIKVSTVASVLGIDADVLESEGESRPVHPQSIPPWIQKTGKQPGGRLCAVGFTLPMFHPDKTFLAVVEDIRAQLAEVIRTFVASHFEERSTESQINVQAMTLATTEAVSKGAIVTDYWYDRDGIGPSGTKRSTYGYGCVHPVDIIMQSTTQAEQMAPEDDAKVIQAVRKRAAEAFDDLDAEIAKREGAQNGAEPEPHPQPEPAPSPEPGISEITDEIAEDPAL